MRKSLLLALSLLGLWDAAYLWWSYTSPSHPLVCFGTAWACDVVRASHYAQLWGLPLPAYGAAMYATLTLLIFAEPLLATGAARAVGYAIAAISGAGFVASLVLTGIEAFVLYAWCEWCVLSALAVTTIFALAVWDVMRPAPSPKAETALGTLRTHFSVVLIAIAVGTPAFVLLARHSVPPPTQQVSAQALAEHLIRADSHRTGSPQAPVTIVEFGDFECPGCGRVAPVVKQILEKYGNQVRFVFRQFPLSGIHMHAESAAEASECAAEQGKFWEAVEELYDRQIDLSEPAIDRYVAELHLDNTRFHACLSSGRPDARVRRDVADGQALGVRATPTFFIGQRKIERPLEFEEFSQLVNQELAARSDQMGHPSANSSDATAPLLGNGPGNAFSQLQPSELTCSEEEAKKRQPSLIGTAQAREYFEGSPKAVFVDVRSSKDFTSGRIRGAINLPVDEIERRWSALPKDQRIVLYESGQSRGDVCASSRAAARVLFAHGFQPNLVRVYQDGLSAWEKAGLPVNR